MRGLRSALAVSLVLGLLAAAPAGAQDRVRSKEVVLGLGAEPRTMLAVTIVDWTTNTQLEHVYDRLLDRDPKTLRPRPMLATGWKIVNDTTWEFTLRRGVKFHNGEPFDAQSVKATMDYLKNPASKSHYAAYWRLVKEVQIVDPYTVRFVTEKPWPSLIDRASLTDFLVLPAKALRELGPEKLNQHPIGTGPFRFVEWKRDERLVLERNPDYWQGPADVARVTFRFIPEFSARMAALLSGEIDVMKDVPPHVLEAVERSGRAKIRAAVSSRINYLALVNLKPGPMQDLRVRRALNHAVNVDELIAQVLKGRATKICGPLSPANVDYAPVECYPYDPQRAAALLREAGHDPAITTTKSGACTNCMYLKAYCPQLFDAPCASATIQMLSVFSQSQPMTSPAPNVPIGSVRASMTGETPSMC